MRRFGRLVIRIAFWGAVLAVVATAADWNQPQPDRVPRDRHETRSPGI
jgi:hypothetical protein